MLDRAEIDGADGCKGAAAQPPRDEPPGDTSEALGFITLEMNDTGNGRGRLAEAVKIHVTEDDVLEIEAARPDVIEMENVIREQ